MTNLGLLDIYKLLGSVSSNLQTVQMFPWDIPRQQEQLIKTLRRMQSLSLTEDDITGEFLEIDESDWLNLGGKVEYVLEDKYIAVPTVLTFGRRRGRSAADISASNKLLKTVENKLTSLVKHLANNLERRLDEDPTPKVVKVLSECLDLKDIIANKDNMEKNADMEKSLKKLCDLAKYSDDKKKEIEQQYKEFKSRLIKIVTPGSEYSEVVDRDQHVLFNLHSCSDMCEKNCFRILHLMLKESTLFTGIEEFLHLYLGCLVKTHAEGIAESLGKYMDMGLRGGPAWT